MIDSAAIIPSLDRFLEAASVAAKWRSLGPIERRLRATMSKAFRAQGRAFLRGFEQLRGRFRESIVEDDWIGIFDAATQETFDLFAQPLQTHVQMALLLGAEDVIAELALGTSFSLRNPRAVNYLDQHGFGLISQINAVTRGNIATIVRHGVAAGWGYGRMATEIRSLYAEMSRTRAETIAVQEAGEAYEEGSQIIVQDLQDAGLQMEKAWLTVGDNRVSAICRGNAGDGWIPLAQAFTSGHMRPLGHVRCRCTAMYRRMGG